MTNPLSGFNQLGANPMFLAGLQILNNNQKGPQYRPAFQGVPNAFAQANQNAFMMQQMQRLGKDQEWQDSERSRLTRERADRAKAYGDISRGISGYRDNVLSGNAAMADEPADIQAMGAPVSNPLSGGQLTNIMLSGDPAMQDAAIAQMMKPEEFTNVAQGGTAYGSNGTILQGAPAEPKNLSKGAKAALAQGLQPGTPEFAKYAGKVDMMPSGSGGAPYFTTQSIVGPDGKPYMVVTNARDGSTKLMDVEGNPVSPAAFDPKLQAEIAGGEKDAQVSAEAQATARVNLPQVEAAGRQTIDLVKALRDHPGMSQVVGAPNLLTGGGRLWGSKGADFRARHQQIQGKQFLQAYETLKGGGQITEVEGLKAENAIARMQTAQSEKEFKVAADEFIRTVEGAVQRARTKAGKQGAGGETPGAPATFNYVPGQGLVPQ